MVPVVTQKWKFYKTVVLRSLLYSCEAWTVYSTHAEKLNILHLTCLRRTRRIRWHDRKQTQRSSKASKYQAPSLRSTSWYGGGVSRTRGPLHARTSLLWELITGKCWTRHVAALLPPLFSHLTLCLTAPTRPFALTFFLRLCPHPFLRSLSPLSDLYLVVFFFSPQ